MFYTIYAELCHKIGRSPSWVAQQLNINKASVTYWKNNPNAKPSNEVVCKIADFFNVSTDYLLGNDSESKDYEEIAKVALFGGDQEVTPEMWEEVKSYAKFIKQKHFKD